MSYVGHRYKKCDVKVRRIVQHIGWLPNGSVHFRKVLFDGYPANAYSLMIFKEQAGSELFCSVSRPVECDVQVTYWEPEKMKNLVPGDVYRDKFGNTLTFTGETEETE